jgi:very-short-patch-repair endonuclease
VTVVDLLVELGGVARRSALLRVVDRGDLERALASGEVVRDARGLYVLPGADEAVRVAARLGGVLSLTSAALAHGWAVKTLPDRPHVTVSRGRRVDPHQRFAHVHRAELRPEQIDDGKTCVETTLEQCMRALPYDEALAIADSARREGVGDSVFQRIADRAKGPGSVQVRRVCSNSSALSANPFESTLRAIGEDVPGLNLRPQVAISDGDFVVHPDLVDERLRVVAEADSFEWHGSRAALASDCRRYNMLVIHGWIVLRFCFEDVMFHPDEVRRVLIAVVALAELLSKAAPPRAPAA